jgi:hypothetical protein
MNELNFFHGNNMHRLSVEIPRAVNRKQIYVQIPEGNATDLDSTVIAELCVLRHTSINLVAAGNMEPVRGDDSAQGEDIPEEPPRIARAPIFMELANAATTGQDDSVNQNPREYLVESRRTFGYVTRPCLILCDDLLEIQV